MIATCDVSLMISYSFIYFIGSHVKLQLNEFIRDGKTVAELMNLGKQMLGEKIFCRS